MKDLEFQSLQIHDFHCGFFSNTWLIKSKKLVFFSKRRLSKCDFCLKPKTKKTKIWEELSQAKIEVKFSECKTWRRCGFHPRGARLIFDNLTRRFLESLVPLARTKPDPSLIRPWIAQIYMIYYIYILWKKYMGFFYLNLKLWYRNWGLGFKDRVRMNEWNNKWERSWRCGGGMWWEWVNEWRRDRSDLFIELFLVV